MCESVASMAISKAAFWSFINELVTRNPNLGIPPLEDDDGLFVNLLIFNYFQGFGVRLRIYICIY